MRAKRLPLLLMVALTCAVLGSGCGGDDGNDELEAAAQQVQRALSQPDCNELRRIGARATQAIGLFPEMGCPKRREARKTLRDFEILDSAEYGTGAVVDYRSAKAPKGSAMVFFEDSAGGWGYAGLGLARTTTVDSGDEKSRTHFDAVVDKYLAAMRERDCRAFFKYSVTQFPKLKTSCRYEFSAHGDLQARLRSDRDPDLEYLGGNEHFGFYGLTTRKPAPDYRTVTVLKTPPGSPEPYLVLNAAKGPVPETDDSDDKTTADAP
jgi:hypothetical protein